ncbi:hypothetical protein BU24DRAFT_462043 [Aaosphaeria arxii CBS 175.79]|uniref:F-box domain-containing protein n=1 Tax=Aaosphaeria arxii CBS 175.79 TaxID=1450172 RepID=A0A6A5XSU4_9PLEO|nr:uncharacterized protein BU24DRAFT_462043 [Aaosphaeria arxii CBS 175.79]KAF2015821.1 hypothetical protein BU24DRAFT_462043 [Aaosphaeria arxii CBS 175.79]
MRPRDFSDDDEPLVDVTAAIPLKSKRTARMNRKKTVRETKERQKPSLTNLPTELVLEVLQYLLPSDVLNLSLVNHRYNAVVNGNANIVGNKIIKRRYAILAQCFQLPRLLSDIEPSMRMILREPTRQKSLTIHRNPYQHIRRPDPQYVCTCVTCILLWHNLCVALDFAHWQDKLDSYEPITMIPRGQSTAWNEALLDRNARIVRKALESSLWHAWILETHLKSTVRAIRRQNANKGNKRKHVDMTPEEAASEMDAFLEKTGPPSHEMPFHRDNYYLLEAYLPRRAWSSKEQRWRYNVAGSHEQDLVYLARSSMP